MDDRSELRVRRLSPATVIALAAMCIALAALVFSMVAPAVAAPTPEERVRELVKGEVELLTTATGSFTTPGEGGTLPLQNASFTQETGDTIIIVIRQDGNLPEFTGDQACQFSFTVEWGPLVEFDITNGGFWQPPAVQGIVPSASAIHYTLGATVAPSCATEG